MKLNQRLEADVRVSVFDIWLENAVHEM